MAQHADTQALSSQPTGDPAADGGFTTAGAYRGDGDHRQGTAQHGAPGAQEQECRYLVKDFGTSQSPKSTRQRDSRYCPD
ncbi:MAG: hypothetical protein AB2814_07535, partial [Candidatus Sedimenticola endophacoides]